MLDPQNTAQSTTMRTISMVILPKLLRAASRIRWKVEGKRRLVRLQLSAWIGLLFPSHNHMYSQFGVIHYLHIPVIALYENER